MENGDCKADLQRNITKTDEHEYDIELKVLVNKSDLLVVVITKAHFVYEAETYEKEESIIKTNTVAIMFPFIRSQVTYFIDYTTRNDSNSITTYKYNKI